MRIGRAELNRQPDDINGVENNFSNAANPTNK